MQSLGQGLGPSVNGIIGDWRLASDYDFVGRDCLVMAITDARSGDCHGQAIRCQSRNITTQNVFSRYRWVVGFPNRP